MEAESKRWDSESDNIGQLGGWRKRDLRSLVLIDKFEFVMRMVELQEVAQGLPHSGNPSFQRLRVYGSVAIKHGRPSASAGDPVLDVVEGLLGLEQRLRVEDGSWE